MDLQQHGIQEDATCIVIVDSNCGCNVGDEGDDDDTANIIGSYLNVDNIEREGTGIVSNIVRACDTDVSHQKIQNRTDDLDLAKISKTFH